MVLIIAAVVHSRECHVAVLTGVGVNLSSTISSVCYHTQNKLHPASMRVEVIIESKVTNSVSYKVYIFF